MQSVLPPAIAPDEFNRTRAETERWLPAIRRIADQHGLSASDLQAFSEGSVVVFSAGTSHVIKLFPPYSPRQFESERRALRSVNDQLSIRTPRLESEGRIGGWFYLVMERLNGEPLSQLWPSLSRANRMGVMADIGRVMAQVHGLQPPEPSPYDLNWRNFIEQQRDSCLRRHKRLGLPYHLLVQIPSYLDHAIEFLPWQVMPVLLTGEYTPTNLLLTRDQGSWKLTGMIDFGDCMLGFHEYDFIGPSTFLACGDPALLKAFLEAYGYEQARRQTALGQRLMALLLLHRYSDFNAQVHLKDWQTEYATFEELEAALWPLGT